jgi:tetratricopeptide (TPR) repeat protein
MSSPAPLSQEQIADTIVRCIDAKDLRKALAVCQQLNREHADYAYGWYLASFLMQKVRHYPDAILAIDRALQLAALDKYRLHKIRCHFEANDLAGAIAAAAVLRDKSFADPLLHSQLGSLLHLLGDNANALVHYSKAIELDPGNAEHYFNRAAVQRYFGDVAGAEAGFDRAIALKPDEFEAYTGRAQLRTQTAERNHVAQLREVLARTRTPVGLVQLNYALAKELEDIGDYEESFACLKQGAAIKRRHMQYSVDTDLQIIAKICEVYGAGMFDGHIEGCDSADPIFILGMPRTGTTLVERILSSHSRVFSAGELNNFSLELLRLARQSPGASPASRLDFVTRTAALDFRALGEAYMGSTRPLRDGSAYFIDKLPFNFLYAGLIHLALPRARIINLQRHPMDTCYAVYKQLFKDAYPYSYDLDELGQYYVAYHRLMQHWNAVMPGVIHTVRYEALVADSEAESRRLLEYCGLPWEDQCLRYYQNTRASTTASALQVRQPIYDTSVGKWRNYARQLEPLRARLDRAGIDTD